MRLRGILFITFVVVTLIAAGGSVSFMPLFDMSRWTTDTYPAFDSNGGLYNAMSPELPSASFGGADPQKINYKPIFDMSPGAFSFNTYPTFSDTGGTGIVFGMMTGIMSRGY